MQISGITTHPNFGWSVFKWLVAIVKADYSKTEPFKIPPSKSVDFKKLQILNGRISDPHCIHFIPLYVVWFSEGLMFCDLKIVLKNKNRFLDGSFCNSRAGGYIKTAKTEIFPVFPRNSLFFGQFCSDRKISVKKRPFFRCNTPPWTLWISDPHCMTLNIWRLQMSLKFKKKIEPLVVSTIITGILFARFRTVKPITKRSAFYL